jgi:phosphoglycerate dehydrogenase-like enzyme
MPRLRARSHQGARRRGRLDPNPESRLRVLVGIFDPDSVWTIPPRYIDDLRSRFPDITFTAAWTIDEIVATIDDIDVAFSPFVTAAALKRARRLKWVHSSAAGVGGLLTPEMIASDVVVTNTRGAHAVAMAEHVIMMMLAMTRRLPVAVRRQAEGRWAQREIYEDRPVFIMRGRRMGLVGLGAIGSEVARLALAIGMRVSAVRRNVDAPKPEGIDRVYPPDRLDTLLGESDVVVLCPPLTRETRGLIGTRELRLMKPTALLINVGRGRLIDEAALAAELARGTIAGAGLDVVAKEPLDPASPLWTLDNLLLTPHVSTARHDFWEAVIDLFAKNLERFLRGEPLMNVVDKNAGY